MGISNFFRGIVRSLFGDSATARPSASTQRHNNYPDPDSESEFESDTDTDIKLSAARSGEPDQEASAGITTDDSVPVKGENMEEKEEFPHLKDSRVVALQKQFDMEMERHRNACDDGCKNATSLRGACDELKFLHDAVVVAAQIAYKEYQEKL